MAKPDTKAIAARAEAATAGPWRAGQRDTHVVFGNIGSPDLMAPILGRVIVQANIHYPFENDMKFIAAARTDVPLLCARVEALEAALRYLRMTFPPDAHGTLAYIDSTLDGREP